MMKGNLNLLSCIKRPLVKKFTATSLSLLSNTSDDWLTWFSYCAEKIPPKNSYEEKIRWIRELFRKNHPSLEVTRCMSRESNPVQRKNIVKLPAHRAGLPGHAVASRMRAKEISFIFVPLDPAYKAGLAGHVPVNFLVNQFLEGANRTKDFESRTCYCPPRSLHPKNRLTPQREPSF